MVLREVLLMATSIESTAIVALIEPTAAVTPTSTTESSILEASAMTLLR
jgi:hypothetical protein